MARFLVHIATGPENPTRAALGLLVARTATAGGTRCASSSPETASTLPTTTPRRP